MNTLIVYFSLGGNTEFVSKKIQQAIDADIIKISPLEPYIGSFDEIAEQGQQEVNRKEKPDLQTIDVDPEDYDCIIVGTPTRRYTMSPCMLSFLSTYDWTDKIVIPFATCSGQPGTTIDDIKKECIGADFKYEKVITYDGEGSKQCITENEEIEEWIENIKNLCA